MSRQIELMAQVCCATWGVAACSDYKPADDTFSGKLQEGDAAADWSCLGPQMAKPPPPPGELGERVFYTLRFVDLATDRPMTGVTVKACGFTDVECSNPVTGKDPETGKPVLLEGNDDGLVNIPLTSNFDGYLEIEAPDAVPYLFRLPDTGLRTMTDFPLAMISAGSFGALLRTFQIDSTQALTSIGVRAFDCRGIPAPGVKLTSDAVGRTWYFSGGAPDLERDTTDIAGLGGLISSETGYKDLTAELPDGTPISYMRLVLRDEFMAAGYLKANPAD